MSMGQRGSRLKMLRSGAIALAVLATVIPAAAEENGPGLDPGSRDIYNFRVDESLRFFDDWERKHPDDPLGPVSDAAAYLFSEFDRLHILESEFFLDRDIFRPRQKLTADAGVRGSFEQALNKGQQLADRKLAQSPQDCDAMFANVLRL